MKHELVFAVFFFCMLRERNLTYTMSEKAFTGCQTRICLLGLWTRAKKKKNCASSVSILHFFFQKAEAQLAYELQAAKINQKIRNEEIQIQVKKKTLNWRDFWCKIPKCRKNLMILNVLNTKPISFFGGTTIYFPEKSSLVFNM